MLCESLELLLLPQAGAVQLAEYSSKYADQYELPASRASV